MPRSNVMSRVVKKYLIIFLLVAACVLTATAVGMATGKRVPASAEDYIVDMKTAGLGSGINVVKARSANDYIRGTAILQREKVDEMTKFQIDQYVPAYKFYSTSDINKLMNDYIKYYDAHNNIAFLGMLNKQFDESIMGSSWFQTKKYKYYNLFEYELNCYQLFLPNYLKRETYENKFASYFLEWLAKLESGASFAEFFDHFGTHLIGCADFGGKMTVSYSIASDKIILNDELYDIMKKLVDKDRFNTKTQTELLKELNIYFSTTYESTDLLTYFYMDAIGPHSYGTNIVSYYEEYYKQWREKLYSGKDGYPRIMNYSGGGLVPLWEILPEPYNTTLSAEMERAFYEYYRDYYDNMLSKFKPSGNIADFAGGSGSKDNPFLIEDVWQLLNIRSEGMRSHYKLIDDIDLSGIEWTPIGGYYMENPFNGTLDGNGKNIKNLTRTRNLYDDRCRCYYGLFGYIGENGVVKNLTFDNVKIHVTGPKPGNSKSRIFVGAVAGIVRGTVENVTVNGECCYDVCTKGTVHVGGIAGCAYRGAKFINCTNNAAVTAARYTSSAGGILGYTAGGIIQYCTNTGRVISKCTGWFGQASAGGIVGNDYCGVHTDISDCKNIGEYKCSAYKGGIGMGDFSQGPSCGRYMLDFYYDLINLEKGLRYG